MPPSKKIKAPPSKPFENEIIEQPITSALEINFMPYAMSVIMSRAIPEIDGFKPAHRKLLYTMYKMGLMTGHRIKSADVVGQTMRLNPHSDGPIYETLVRLTRGNDALLHPFVDSKGNFGKQFSRDMDYAASRYTEVKLDEICREIFADIDKNVVDMTENYNNTTYEPVLLPTTFPNLLVTPNQGIAVGMASSVCGFNLREVCETTIKFLKNPNHDISITLLAPDFSTGGEILYNDSDLKSIYATGRGSVRLRARWRFDKKNSCAEVYEIPYTTTAEAIIDKIAALVKAGKLRDINDVRDETDLKGLKIAIDIKKSADPDAVMRRLFSQTTLSDVYNCNFNFLIDGKPRTMGVAEILSEWTRFRIGCVKRQLTFDIEKKTEKLHLLEGLSKILLDIDKAIKIIRQTESESLVIPNLMKAFKITEPQADYVAEIKLRFLNRQHLLERVNERESLKKEIGELSQTLGSDENIKAHIAEQLRAVTKKYSAPRRTEIVYEDYAPAAAEEELIEDYNIKLFLTEHNYFKKISLVSLRSSGAPYLKDDDAIIQELETTNRAEILFFTDRQNVYKTKASELPDGKTSGLGEYLPALLGMDENERVLYIAAANGDYAGFMVFGFENGKAAKVSFDGYATLTNRKKLVSAYSNKSKLVAMRRIFEDCDFLLARDGDKLMVINSSLVTANASKASSGMQVFAMKKKSILTEIRLLSETELTGEEIDFYRADKIPSAGHFRLK